MKLNSNALFLITQFVFLLHKNVRTASVHVRNLEDPSLDEIDDTVENPIVPETKKVDYENDIFKTIKKNFPDWCNYSLLNCQKNEDGESVLTDVQIVGEGIKSILSNSIDEFENLNTIDLAVNEITGPIPKAIGKLKKLKEIMLNKNKITGPIPSEIGEAKKFGKNISK